MGRRLGRVSAYYWWSKSKNVRVGWIFPSRKAAEQWRDSKYYKFVDYGALEYFLETIPKSRQVKERELWIAHRDNWKDLEMRVGRVVYQNGN